MMWQAWRNQRLIILIAIVGTAGFSLWAIIHGAHEQAAWARYLKDGCLSSRSVAVPFCEGNRVYDFNHWNSFFLAGFYAIPGLVGILLGAPLIAQEIQQGTNRLSWTQSITRVRWLCLKLLVGGMATVAISIGLVVLGEWWVGAVRAAGSFKPENYNIFPANFDLTGIAPVAYGLFAFMLGAFLGAVIRRTGWAVLVGLIGFGGLRALIRLNVRSHLAPIATGLLSGSTAPPHSWWIIQSGWVPLGRTNPSANHTWGSGTDTVLRCIERLGTHRLANGGSVTYFGAGIYQRCGALEKLHYVVQYQPSSHYWAIQAAEAGIFLGLAGVLFALTVMAVKSWRS